MAFLGDLVVKMGANINPFQSAMKKAANVTAALKTSLTDMKTTAGVFAKLAASIKATNNQMDRLIHVSKSALNATKGMATAEHHQFQLRMKQLKMIADAQRAAQPKQSGGGSMIGAGIAGGIAGAAASGIAGMASSGVGAITDIGIGMVNLAADAETSRIQFGVLLGDAAKGVSMFKDIEKFAARTSFNLDSASGAATKLLAAGVDEKQVMGTMQLLGDLAMGDAEKLGFLSKAYTDVFNKGKLQGQELRQFAENGVGLASALSKTIGVSTAEVLKMSEDGKISFTDMQAALISLTGEGGRFHGMMARINETFKGQWNSLIENIQTVGRDLGAMILPHLTSMVSEINKFLQGFMEVADKGKLIGDLFEAGMDVAIQTIAVKWSKMLATIVKDTVTSVSQLTKGIASGKMSGVMGGIMAATGQRRGRSGEGTLRVAKERFSSLWQNVQDKAPVPVAPPPLLDPAAEAKNTAAKKLSESFKGIFEKVSPMASGVVQAAKTKITGAGITGNWLMKSAENIFTDTGKPKAKSAEQAAAANKGSQEALRIAMRGTKSTYETKALKWQEKAFEIAKQQLIATKEATQQLVAEF